MKGSIQNLGEEKVSINCHLLRLQIFTRQSPSSNNQIYQAMYASSDNILNTIWVCILHIQYYSQPIYLKYTEPAYITVHIISITSLFLETLVHTWKVFYFIKWQPTRLKHKYYLVVLRLFRTIFICTKINNLLTFLPQHHFWTLFFSGSSTYLKAIPLTFGIICVMSDFPPLLVNFKPEFYTSETLWSPKLNNIEAGTCVKHTLGQI